MIKYLLLLAAVGFMIGCEVDNTSTSNDAELEQAMAGGSNTSTNTDSTVQNPGPGETSTNMAADQAEWDSIQWYTAKGPSGKGATKVMSLTAQIIDGDKVRFTWDQYPWGGEWGVGHFFVLEGGVYKGGKFEWIRNPGQGIKGLGNIRAGYNGLGAPAPGTPVAFAWTSSDGRQRSNLAKTTWR